MLCSLTSVFPWREGEVLAKTDGFAPTKTDDAPTQTHTLNCKQWRPRRQPALSATQRDTTSEPARASPRHLHRPLLLPTPPPFRLHPSCRRRPSSHPLRFARRLRRRSRRDLRPWTSSSPCVRLDAGRLSIACSARSTLLPPRCSVWMLPRTTAERIRTPTTRWSSQPLGRSRLSITSTVSWEQTLGDSL